MGNGILNQKGQQRTGQKERAYWGFLEQRLLKREPRKSTYSLSVHELWYHYDNERGPCLNSTFPSDLGESKTFSVHGCPPPA
jgi:hypothetical protein